MTDALQNGGLFHSARDIQLAREHADREPILSALRRLDAPAGDPLEHAQLLATRAQFYADDKAAEAARQALLQAETTLNERGDLAAIQRALAWLSVVAMLGAPLESYPAGTNAITGLLEGAPAELKIQALWRGALSMAFGILLDDHARVEEGAAVYRRVIDERVHPEGYFKGVVDREGAKATYEAQLSWLCAIVLMAEMAGRAGIDLWAYENRAVGLFTAATYTHFYYHFPEKWRWETGLTRDDARKIMRRDGAFLELVNRRSPPQGIEHFLAEQRPLYSLRAGGLTTLTHALTPPKKKRWRLW